MNKAKKGSIYSPSLSTIDDRFRQQTDKKLRLLSYSAPRMGQPPPRLRHLKNWTLLLLLIFLAASVQAAAGPVLILKLQYDHGNVTLADQIVKYGFAPDRKVQPDVGYRLEALSKKGAVLNTFTFPEPNAFIAEGSDENGQLTGGPVILEQTDFALTLPYSPEIAMIRIRNTDNKIVGLISIEKEQKFRIAKVLAWSFLGIAMLLTLVALLRRKK